MDENWGVAGSRWIWAGVGLVAGAGLVGLGVFLEGAGLDDADKIASVIALFVGLVGLGVAVYGVVQARRQANGREQSGSSESSGSASPGAVVTFGERSPAVGTNEGIINTGDDNTFPQ